MAGISKVRMDELLERAKGIAAKALGKSIRVRTGPNQILSGTVAECVPTGKVSWHGMTYYATFKVTVEHGPNKNRQDFILSKLPQ